MVFSSHLVRAVKTAQIISGSDDIIIDDRLIELDNGKFEGMSVDEIIAAHS